jgi:hypothetical protein
MTPEVALRILAQVAEQCALPKAGHIQVEQALAVLAEAIKKEKE